MSVGHGYKIGDLVRVTRSDDEGDPDVGEICRVENIDSSDCPVLLEGYQWMYLEQIQPIDAAALRPAPVITGEGMAQAHAMAWRIALAKSPREFLIATGWTEHERTWKFDEHGYRVEFGRGDAWLYGFEGPAEPGFPDGFVGSLDARTLRAFADLLDEVTP
jgi:hypothetical protein